MADVFLQDMLSEAKQNFIEGHYNVAEPLLSQLTLQNTRNPEIYQMLGTIYYDKGQFNKAIRTFKRALEIDPTYTDASIGLSIILNDLGRYEEGKQIFEEARRIHDLRNRQSDPFWDEKLALKHEELADLYLQGKRFTESVEQLLKAQKLTTRKADLGLKLVDIFLKIKDYGKALKEAKNILKDHPGFIQARLKLGLIYYQQGQMHEAAEQWELILAKDPKHPEAQKFIKLTQNSRYTQIDL